MPPKLQNHAYNPNRALVITVEKSTSLERAPPGVRSAVIVTSSITHPKCARRLKKTNSTNKKMQPTQ
jgi:hypothetical protein